MLNLKILFLLPSMKREANTIYGGGSSQDHQHSKKKWECGAVIKRWGQSLGGWRPTDNPQQSHASCIPLGD